MPSAEEIFQEAGVSSELCRVVFQELGDTAEDLAECEEGDLVEFLEEHTGDERSLRVALTRCGARIAKPSASSDVEDLLVRFHVSPGVAARVTRELAEHVEDLVLATEEDLVDFEGPLSPTDRVHFREALKSVGARVELQSPKSVCRPQPVSELLRSRGVDDTVGARVEPQSPKSVCRPQTVSELLRSHGVDDTTAGLVLTYLVEDAEDCALATDEDVDSFCQEHCLFGRVADAVRAALVAGGAELSTPVDDDDERETSFCIEGGPSVAVDARSGLLHRGTSAIAKGARGREIFS